MRYITKDKLQGDIYTYRRLKAKKFSQEGYYKSEEIADRADSLLLQYADGSIDVRDDTKKTMAQYIDTFAGNEERRENLLDKLQHDSFFDVRKYLTDSKRTYWEKLFNLDPNRARTVSIFGLNRRISSYNRLNRKLADGWYHKDKDYQKQYILESEAEHYASDFLNGSLGVTRKEIPTLKNYFQTFQNRHYSDNIHDALEKIRKTSTEDFAETKPSRWQLFKQSVKNKWNGMVAGLKNRFTPKRAVVVKMHRRNWADVAVISAVFALAGISLFKSDSVAKDTRNTPDMEVKKTDEPKQQQDVSVKTDAFMQTAQELTHEQKIWKNFYDTKNEIQAADAGIDLQGLYEKIAEQQKAGIFVMPEGTSVERFAYTHLMYKAYGLNSPLDAVVNGMQRLSADQQAAVEEAVKTAGENGVGVKKIAALQSKRMGRALGNHSAYDMASKDLKQKYINSVRAVKNLQQR